MNLIANSKIANSQVTSAQLGNLIFQPKVFSKKSLKQITDTEISYCNVSFSDFANVFRFEIAGIIGDEFSEQIVFTLENADGFLLHLKLNGHWELDREPEFRLNNIDWHFEERKNIPTSAFVLETFRAILCLSSKVKVEIPSIDYGFEASIPLPLNNISETLQNRQLAYRLMVLEKAFRTPLVFPRRFIMGEEVENIFFCYYAVVDKQFEQAGDTITFFPPAAEENLKYLPAENTSYHLTFPTLNEVRVILNQQLFFGQFLIDIEEAIVENYEEVKESFAKLNNQPVKIVVKSLTGKIKYTSLTAPNLPENAWTIEIQKLIDLDEKINSVFLERYFKLAASTLEGLSEEQKESITERPELSIKGFD